MARSKSQLTQAKRARETARLEKRARKLEKKEARKLAALDPSTDTHTDMDMDMDMNLGLDTETETVVAADDSVVESAPLSQP